MAPRTTTADRVLRALDRSTPADELAHLSTQRSSEVREAVALNPATPVAVLVALAGDRSDDVASTAAHNLSATREVWDAALEAGRRWAVAQVTWLPTEMVDELAGDGDAEIRRMVAEATARPDLVRLLAADPETAVRVAAAGSDAADLDVLLSLLADRRREVRAAAACNDAVPVEHLERLAGDPSADVRWAVVIAHPDKPELQRHFLDDADEDIRDHAREALERPARRVDREDGTTDFVREGDEDDELGWEEDWDEDDLGPLDAEMDRQRVEAHSRRLALLEATRGGPAAG